MRSMDMEDTAHYIAGHAGGSESAVVNLTKAWDNSMSGLAARARSGSRAGPSTSGNNCRPPLSGCSRGLTEYAYNATSCFAHE